MLIETYDEFYDKFYDEHHDDFGTRVARYFWVDFRRGLRWRVRRVVLPSYLITMYTVESQGLTRVRDVQTWVSLAYRT